MVPPRGEWVYTIVEDLTLHCFSTSTENLEQAMQVSGLGALGDVDIHMHMCMNAERKKPSSSPVCHILMYIAMCPYCTCPSPQVHNKDRCDWPHLHQYHNLYTGLPFGEDRQ